MSETPNSTPALSELINGNGEAVKAAVAAKVAEKATAKKTPKAKAPKKPKASKPAKAAPKAKASKKTKTKPAAKPKAAKAKKTPKVRTRRLESKIEVTSAYLIEHSGNESNIAPEIAKKLKIKEVEVHRAARRLERLGYKVDATRAEKRDERGRRPFIYTISGKPTKIEKK